MKTFLTLMLGATILMGVTPAQADLANSTRAALRLLVSPVTANDQIFINNMKTNYGLLKDFEAEPGEEATDYYPLVSVLLEIKALAKEVVDLSATLSSPMNDGYDEALKTLHEKYDRAEKLWEQLEKLNNESPLAYFTSFIQNFSVKTAWAGGFTADPEDVKKALDQIKKNREEHCKLLGMELYGKKCCHTYDDNCICEGIGGDLAEDKTCCPRQDVDCICEHSPHYQDTCKCAKYDTAEERQECVCEKRKGEWYPSKDRFAEVKGTCCYPPQSPYAVAHEPYEACKCRVEDKKWYGTGKCCEKGQVWIPWSGDPS